MDLSGFGPALTLLGTFGGVWIVILLFRWIQRDFVETYRAELAAVRAELAAAHSDLERERIRRQHAEEREAAARLELYRHGIPAPDPHEGDPTR